MGKQVAIKWLEEVESTQDVLQKGISRYDNLSVVAARSQTAGRGQRGNSWLARKGENLTFSVLLKFGVGGFPPFPASEQFRISEAVSSGVCDYLSSKGIDSRIKWPNDIYVRNKKICGMLIENTLNGSDIATSIVGIGLNVNQREFPPQLVNPTSMSQVTGEEYDLELELELLTGFLFPDGEIKDSESSYWERLYRFGEFHQYTDCLEGTVFEGRIVGVSPQGLLEVETRKGELKKFAFKEISYII